MPGAIGDRALSKQCYTVCFMTNHRRAKKLTEFEKWEYKQLMMSGVLDVREYPLFDEEEGMGVLANVDEVCLVSRWNSTSLGALGM